MARQLTTFSKFLITLIVIALIFFGGKWLINNTGLGEAIGVDGESQKSSRENAGFVSDEDDVLNVQLVTWGGYAPGLYFNEGSEPTKESRFFKDYGLKVRFVKNDDLIAALNAWIAGDYDVLVQTADAFPLYTFPEDLNQYKPQVFMQVDWSRGGDVIIAKRGINSINDLKGKRVAVTEPSPSQTLLITALEAAGLSYDDIEVVAVQDPIVAAQAFTAPNVDAAVVWSPFELEAVREVPGSKVLLTTKEQSHIIGDIMFAKEEYLLRNRDKIDAFYEGWMKSVAELNTNPSNQDKAAQILAEFLEFPLEDAKGAMENVRWSTHGDNMNFFGLNPDYRGMKGADLYNKMAQKFHELGQADKVAPPWRSVAFTSSILAADSRLSGSGYQAEEMPEFAPPTEEEKELPAVATKPVSINFATGQHQLTENAKTIIDLQFADIARSFANMRIRIEGNTDNVGSRNMNMDLSRKRANAVSKYLQNQYGMDTNRFVIVGNGPDNPMPGCEGNQSADCRAKNRRTDFQLIPGN